MKLVLFAIPIMDYVGNKLKPIAMDAGRQIPPYGIYTLANILRKAGHEVILVDLIALGSRNIKPFKDEIEKCSLVGIGATSLSWPTAVDIIHQVRKIRRNVPIVLGAIHPTMFDHYILTEFPVDYIIRGEAEVALPLLCETLEKGAELSCVPNLSWKTNTGEIQQNALAPQISGSDIASFPLFDYSTIPANVYKALPIESSRGCAFDCAFCSTSYRKSWRGLPVEKFVDRLEIVMNYIHLVTSKSIHIIDDEFSTDAKRATEIAKTIHRRGLQPKLVFDSRAHDILYKGYLDNIAEFTGAFLVGAECGYDEGLSRVGKGITCAVLDEAARRIQLHGLSNLASFSFILGLPWETRAEVEKTIRFAAHLYATYGVRILLQWYCQIPGSRLWDENYRKGLVNPAIYNTYGFFRNLYLFRTGVQLSPSDIWEIQEIISQLQFIAETQSSESKMIESALPPPIHEFFPREYLDKSNGLDNLRQVSKSVMRFGIPERSFE